jgi:small conductance mechanosensitive channel
MDAFLSNLSESWSKLLEKMGTWLDTLVLQLPNFILAILVMGISIFLLRYVRRYASKALNKMLNNQTVTSLFSNVIAFGFLLIALFLVLDILNLDKALTSLLAGAGVAGLAVGLALQEPLINIFSGILMSVRSLYNIGDFVQTNGYIGTIRNVNLRFTSIKTVTGETVAIPNKLIIQNPLQNYTVDPGRTVEIGCGISYGDDLERVEEIVRSTLSETYSVRSEEVLFFFTGFGNSSIDFKVRIRLLSCKSNPEYLKETSRGIKALKAAFDREDITIPFPIRTLDFGIKGGVPLHQEMPVEQTNGQS